MQDAGDARPAATGAAHPELNRLLTEAHLRLRQEQYADARARLDAAKAIAPDDPAVLELDGDLAFAQHRYKQAELTYRRAFELDRTNTRVEDKYATALLKGSEFQFNTIPDVDDSFWSMLVKRPPWASTLLSAVLPGLGQLYNGDLLKGGALVFVEIMCWSFILGVIHQLHQAGTAATLVTILPALLHGAGILMLLVMLAAWGYGIIDAYLTAKSMQE